jgi:hypothetical protein
MSIVTKYFEKDLNLKKTLLRTERAFELKVTLDFSLKSHYLDWKIVTLF